MPVIPALKKLRQEDWKFEVSLWHIVGLCLKKQKNKPNQNNRTKIKFIFLLLSFFWGGKE
jgi:hypothetical protein